MYSGVQMLLQNEQPEVSVAGVAYGSIENIMNVDEVNNTEFYNIALSAMSSTMPNKLYINKLYTFVLNWTRINYY